MSETLENKFSFATEEEKILEFWNDINAFQTSLKLSEGRPEYTFYDGPPFATGTPHYGYVLTNHLYFLIWSKFIFFLVISLQELLKILSHVMLIKLVIMSPEDLVGIAMVYQ